MKNFIVLLFTFHISHFAFSQDDLMKMIEQPAASKQPVIATFKTTRIINAHSNETVKGHTLDFRVTHRFGDIASSSSNIHNGYGLYNIQDVRIAFEYGVTDKLTLALAKEKFHEFMDGYIKYRLLQQTSDNKIPIGITLFANTAYTFMTASTDSTSEYSYQNTTQRLSYAFQPIITRKFNDHISIAILPTYVHRNYVAAVDDNGIFAVGIGGRFRFSRSCSFIADYFYVLNGEKRTKDFQAIDPAHPSFYNPLAVGLEIETGGHVFHLTFTNSEGIIENSYIPFTMKSWTKGEFRWGFNISRVFNIGKK